MLTFIRNDSLEAIRSKLIILYILNVTDIIFTLFLIDTGYFIEANSFMSGVVQSTTGSLLLKAVLPAALILFLYIRFKDAHYKQLKYSNYIINAALGLYVLINLSHVFWVSLIPVFMVLSQ